MGASTQTSPSAVGPETIERYAELVVSLGANVQPGQIVEVRAVVENAELVRAIAAAAYRRGARFVDARYFDWRVRRARIEQASEESLEFVPSWERERILQLGEQRCARIGLGPLMPPGAFADLDPVRVAREPLPALPESLKLVMDGTTNWTSAPAPAPAWAMRVYPELGPEAALERLWSQVVHMLRLDEPDAEAAWRERFAQLQAAASALQELRLDALHFEGPGTDLTIGLLDTSRWEGGPGATVDGIEHGPNLPTEEIFTAPDPERTEGVVAATRPLLLKSGVLVEGLVVRFEGGRAIGVDAERGADAMRELLAEDDGAARLGEVALVDRESRVGRLETVFWNTLLDENATSHIAVGGAYPETVGDEDRERINQSRIHCDFMVGGGDVDVTGITRDGSRMPLLRGGIWTKEIRRAGDAFVPQTD